MKMMRIHEERIRAFNTRNTKLWCRGRVGIEHQFVWTVEYCYMAGNSPKGAEREVCSECGRKARIREMTLEEAKVAWESRNSSKWQA
jgi:hypothetical protein